MHYFKRLNRLVNIRKKIKKIKIIILKGWLTRRVFSIFPLFLVQLYNGMNILTVAKQIHEECVLNIDMIIVLNF